MRTIYHLPFIFCVVGLEMMFTDIVTSVTLSPVNRLSLEVCIVSEIITFSVEWWGHSIHPVNRSIHTFTHPFVHPAIHLFINLSIIDLSIHPSIQPLSLPKPPEQVSLPSTPQHTCSGCEVQFLLIGQNPS